jgi:hypothetical protein
MKVLRAHDYPQNQKAPEPDFRGLRRIMAFFLTALILSTLICAATIIRDGTHHSTMPVAVHHPCASSGRHNR